MHVIGAGVGRTGTYSLKEAINQLGLGPCHHMEEVLQNPQAQLPLWKAAAAGQADWPSVFANYKSAVDWPTARFYRELNEAYPDAKFVLTVRSAESWAESFAETIYTVMASKNQMPPEMHEWHEVAYSIIAATGFPLGLEKSELMTRFEEHNAQVKATIPADRLLVFEVRDGWAPLCDFLGVEAPSTAFPRTNNRTEFWDLVRGET